VSSIVWVFTCFVFDHKVTIPQARFLFRSQEVKIIDGFWFFQTPPTTMTSLRIHCSKTSFVGCLPMFHGNKRFQFSSPWFYWNWLKHLSKNQISWLYYQKIWVILSWFTALFFLPYATCKQVFLIIIIVFFFMCFSLLS